MGSFVFVMEDGGLTEGEGRLKIDSGDRVEPWRGENRGEGIH